MSQGLQGSPRGNAWSGPSALLALVALCCACGLSGREFGDFGGAPPADAATAGDGGGPGDAELVDGGLVPGGDAGPTDAGRGDAGGLDAGPADAGPFAVTVHWTAPAPGDTVSGRATFSVAGQGFLNVEIFAGTTMIARCAVSADQTRAGADIDTAQFADGPLILTAHAWNSPPGTPFTRDADAGPLTVTVHNASPCAGVACSGHGHCLSSGGVPACACDAGYHANGLGCEPDARPPALRGVYCGNTPSDVTQFETWLGRPVDGILGYTGNASWADYDGSVGWAIGVWSALDRRVLWSVPLIPTGANLHDAALGNYNDHYRQAAQKLAAFRPREPVLYVRTAWEFNGDWFPWTAQGKAPDFVGAFRQFVTTFRAVSSRFAFEWNVNVGDVGMNPEDAYPGDDVVDIIGMDFYWNTQWDPKDPAAAWTSMRTRPYGLDWHQAFAAAHGKPTAYSEWGVNSDAGSYIDSAKAWFDSHPVVYQTYWNSNSAFAGKLSDGQYPTSGARYIADFGP